MKEFDSIIGYASIKRELEQISDTLLHGEVYAALGAKSPKGLLLHGDPGVGKTLMANCLISASGRKAYVCRKNEPDGDFVNTITNTFAQAMQNAPSIIFLDDMDKFTNGDERHTDAEEYVTVQSCIDELGDAEVFVLATANNIRTLPYSLRRAGRFDRVLEVENPEGKDAEDIVSHYLRGKKFVNDIDARCIARIMDGRSCAELETVINAAALYAGFERRKSVTMDHFMRAALKTVFKMNDDCDDCDYSSESVMKEQVAYHEAGHTVISEVLAPESITFTSICSSRGRTSGITSYYCDRSMLPMLWQKSRIAASLGGMAAEELRYGTPDMGSSRDLDHAFDMIRRLVSNSCCCGFSLHSDCDDSQDLKARQEQAVAAEVERYYRKAKEILVLNARFFERIAGELMKSPLLTMQDIERIKAQCTIVPVAV